jgi:hypothetical protein
VLCKYKHCFSLYNLEGKIIDYLDYLPQLMLQVQQFHSILFFMKHSNENIFSSIFQCHGLEHVHGNIF